MRRIHCFSSEKKLYKIKGPYFLLANHNMDLDGVLVGIAFRKHMFFVASDHIMRKGILSKLLIHAVAPIARVKGKTDAYTVIQMIQSLKAGNNVCMFAEGNRSFNGMTGDIPDVTAKVIKKAGAKLITYKISGGYFTQPRWGFSIRKGKSFGKVVNIYEPEEIKELSIEKLNIKIRQDLYVDAYKDQEKNPIKFKGKNRAVGMETAMFMCPHCKKIGTLLSMGNEITCPCGFKAHYTEYGMLENMPKNMDTITKWDIFQRNELKNQMKEKKMDLKSAVFSDLQVDFYRVDNRHKKYKEQQGIITAYADRIVCCGEEIMIEDISTFSIYGRNILTFMYNNEHCEIKGEKLFSALKYSYLFETVKEVLK
jgi:1-acyl-sn-glycerol-3-phosphate acyltransferase